MPVQPTYPGVYIQEIPSGVRTITGVSTSVTAFLGVAKRGPVNRAVHVLSLSDYERSFGGLSEASPMSYAVSQFFLNGGTEAWVVRLAKGAARASMPLKDASGQTVLNVNALDEGKEGNSIQVQVEPNLLHPGNFDITFFYTSTDNPADSRAETFQNVSLDPQSSRYVGDLINDVSQLVTVTEESSGSGAASAGSTALVTTTAKVPAKLESTGGTFTSDPFADGDFGTGAEALPNAAHNSFMISIDGDGASLVTIDSTPLPVSDPLEKKLEGIAARIQKTVRKVKPALPAYRNFTCTASDDKKHLVLASGTIDSGSSVVVNAAKDKDIAQQLHFLKGGILTSGAFHDTDLDALPSTDHDSFMISIDGDTPSLVTLPDTNAAGSDLGAKLGDIAQHIQNAVQSVKPAPVPPAYANFTCKASDDKKHLVLTSGSGSSSITVSPAQSKDIAQQLHLLSGVVQSQVGASQGNSPVLVGGAGDNVFADEDDEYNTFIGDPIRSLTNREGIYALEAVDLFNLMCLPAVTNPSILAEALAYCKKRRAFLIIDAPLDTASTPHKNKTPDDMVTFMNGPNLTKGDFGTYAALYYPWPKVADPLNNGKLRLFPPSGMIAGLYARTDSTRGVWKAPAGTDAVMVGVRGLEHQLTDMENGSLNPHGINCIRVFPVYGPVCWGARTVSGDDQIASEYKYVPIRRLALYIEESLYRGLKWVVFEPNDEPLWAQIRLNAGAFMHNLFRQGAFQGQTPKDAYFVKCDKETTTQNDRDLGIVNIVVGFAPLKPAEFVIISLQQIAGQIEV